MSESLVSKIQSFGFEIDSLNLDGRVHRFRTTNKPKKKNGWYVGKTITLRGNRSLDVVTVGDWARGETKTFTSNDEISDGDRKMFSAASKKMQDEMDKMRAVEREKAAKEAALIWADGVSVEKGFEYLQKKHIETLKAVDSIRMTKDKASLVIPVFNIKGEIRSCQIISASGEKKYLTGGEIKANFFPIKGAGDKCVVCEGFATAASIYSSLSGQVSIIVAFNASNLFHVAAQMVLEYGAERVFVAADDDRYNGHNAGLTYAEKCKELGVKVIVPNFERVGYASKPTDFNDLHCLMGLSELTAQWQEIGFFGENTAKNTSEESISGSESESSECLWPSKDVGFYISVPKEKNKDEFKLEPRFNELAKYFRHDLGVRTSDSMFLRYTGTHYMRLRRSELFSLIYKETKNRVLPDHLEKFAKIVKAECDESTMSFEPNDFLINLKNGILNVKTKELSPHSSRFDFRYCLPYEHDPKAKAPVWLKFLNETFLNDADLVGLASEIVGYTVLGGRPFLHKCFMLYGAGRNGKSVFTDTIGALLGEENCSNVSVESLTENVFSRASLLGKSINISGETGKRDIDSQIFKEIVAGGKITASYKGVDEFEFKPTCRMFFNGNFFPRFNDSSTGMNDRLIFLPFENYLTDSERDGNLELKLNTELSGIFNWALEGLDALLSRDHLRTAQSVDDLKMSYQMESCSVFSFMTNELVKNTTNSKIPISSFYEPYRSYCHKSYIPPKSLIGFSMVLTRYIQKDFGKNAIIKNRGKTNETTALVLWSSFESEKESNGTSKSETWAAGTRSIENDKKDLSTRGVENHALRIKTLQ